MSRNDDGYSSTQFVCIAEYFEVDKLEMSFFDSEEEFNELNDESDQKIHFKGYVDIQDVEIFEHPDFESFIKDKDE